MKKLIVAVLLVMCAVLINVAAASYDTTQIPKASPDLAEFIIITPDAVYDTYGHSDRTKIMYNLARFKELYIESTKQVQMLQAKIKLLEDKTKELDDEVNILEKSLVPVVDVNNP